MAKTYTFTRVEGFNKALRAIPKEAAPALRDAAQAIAGDIASKAATRARMVGGVAKYVAPTIRPARDRIPKVLMGGSTSLPTSGTGWSRSRSGPSQTVGDVWAGAEFGGGKRARTPAGGSTLQFRPYLPSPTGRGGSGYFLFPTVRDRQDEIMDRYGDALMDAVDSAARKGG